MNNELRRRNAFWRKLEYDLDLLIEDIKARQAEHWCDENDLAGMKAIQFLLQEGLESARTHFILSLRSLNDEWQQTKEGTHE